MEAKLKKTLRALSLELRHILEGTYDKRGTFQPGDLEQRLNAIGIWRDRRPKPIEELTLSPEDLAARQVVDAFMQFRDEAGVSRPEAIAEFVRESAYTWANRLLTLRCMEARAIMDEVILQKDGYGGRSLVHNRFARRNPDVCAGEDDGLFALLMQAFEARSAELPGLFNLKAPAIALRPSVAALKRCVALLSGREGLPGQEPATDAVFEAADALGWAYQYWNTEEKDRVFEKVRTKKGAKIEGADIVPATQLYTEPYMVKFLVQNSLGASWIGMHPESRLYEQWEYYVRDADRAPVTRKTVEEMTFLDPACGSGHFLLEAFDLFYPMYREEGKLKEPRAICAAILNGNLFGIDIDERAVQITTAALWMKAKEQAPDVEPEALTTFHDHLLATNIRLPRGKDHLEEFLKRYPEDELLRTALLTVFEGLENAPELGSLLQIEEPVEKELRYLKGREEEGSTEKVQLNLLEPVAVQTVLPMGVESFEAWKEKTLNRLMTHFEQEAEVADRIQAFFGESAGQGLALFDLLARRYDVVAANPPYMGSKNMGTMLKSYVTKHYAPGKRDLYATFILRCWSLTQQWGQVAMVTQQSWMFLRSFAELRAMEAEKLETVKPGAFTGLLREATIETLAHLGEHAFNDSSAAGAFVAVFTIANRPPSENHRLTAFRLVGLKSPEEKDKILKEAILQG